MSSTPIALGRPWARPSRQRKRAPPGSTPPPSRGLPLPLPVRAARERGGGRRRLAASVLGSEVCPSRTPPARPCPRRGPELATSNPAACHRSRPLVRKLSRNPQAQARSRALARPSSFAPVRKPCP
ncbi:Unconventional Myosin-If [Manis pentadactyla]|nr:Unconventional Myosin-If [Manis pentadactyla]